MNITRLYVFSKHYFGHTELISFLYTDYGDFRGKKLISASQLIRSNSLDFYTIYALTLGGVLNGMVAISIPTEETSITYVCIGKRREK
jgi:hypothetical protein